jgi:4-hydroxy 2-oxovalerate aldolase
MYGWRMTVHVLETTIRDGGYEISHQFTEEDVALAVSTLEHAGVSYIEVGYGMGVGAHKFSTATRPKERPAAGDQAHMTTARATARRAKIGVLFVAGDLFCPIDYLDEVAAAGMDFVRLAFMPSDVTPANLRYIERARALGLTVSINCMQTYLLPPREIAQLAAVCRRAGADWWFVVDSAGGMQPAEVRQYVRAIRETTDVEVGLHAHNNLGMAVANSLAAVEEGATLVDCTLNGLGRATGNAPTEQLILALQAMGHEAEIDIAPIARLSAMYRVLFEDKGNSPMHFVSGASMLHSRNVPAVTAQAKARGLSLADFMVRVGREARQANCLDQFVFPPEVFERAAQHSKVDGSAEPAAALVNAIAGRLVARERPGLELLCEDLAVRAARYHVPSVLHVVPDEVFPFDGALPWQSGALVGASVRWPGPGELGPYRQPDYLLVDTSLAGQAGLPACRQRSFACAWQDLWHDAIRAAVTVASAAGAADVWMPADDDPRLRLIANRLASAGFEVAPDRPRGDRVIVVATSRVARWLDGLRAGDVVIMIDRGGEARSAVDAIRSAGARALAPPIGAVVAARVQELVALTAQLAPALDHPDPGARWVDPIFAPGTDQAVVDIGLATVVEAAGQPWAELAARIADARARTLTTGTGKP